MHHRKVTEDKFVSSFARVTEKEEYLPQVYNCGKTELFSRRYPTKDLS